MDDNLYIEIPWELLGDALTGNLTPDSEKELQLWLSKDPENEKTFVQIQELWKNGMEDYRFYKMADENESWKSLQYRMKNASVGKDQSHTIRGTINPSRLWTRRILAVAAVSAGIIGLVWFATVRIKPVVYQTAGNIETITLSDGTTITLHEQTRIEVPRLYGKSDRTIRMSSGEAEFEVVHHAENPFSVELGSTLVRDIGTRFFIRKEDQSIHLAVSEGRVSFSRTTDGMGREIDAGSAIAFDTKTMEFGKTQPVASSRAVESLLSFEGTPLSKVMEELHTVFGKQVTAETGTEQWKLTAKLYGMSYEEAIHVICITMGLESETINGITMLKSREKELH